MASPNILATHVQANSTQPEVEANEGTDQLDNAMNAVGSVDLTAGGTIALTTAQVYYKARLNLTGSPGAAVTITMPGALARSNITFKNSCGQTVTLDNNNADAANPVTMLDGVTKTISYDGTDFIEAGGGATTFIELADVPSSYSGQSLKTVRVNAAENALEFGAGGGGSAYIAEEWDPLSSGVASAVSTLDLSFVDPSLYDEIEILIYDLVTSVDGGVISFQITDDAFSTVEGASGDYAWAYATGDPGATATGDGNDSTTNIQIGSGLDTTASNVVGALKINAYYPNSGNNKQFSYNSMQRDSSAGEFRAVFGGGVFKGNTNAINGIRLSVDSGTFSIGKYVVRGRLSTPKSIANIFADWETIDQVVVSSAVGTVELGIDVFDPSVWAEIEISVLGLYTSVGTQPIDFRVSDDNGATFEQTGSDYEWAYFGPRSDSATEIEQRSASDGSIEIYGFGSAASTECWNFWIRAGAMDSGAHKGFGVTFSRWGSDIHIHTIGGGAYKGSTNDINAFQFDFGTADVTGGIFTLRGRRKGPTLLAKSGQEVVISKQTASASSEIVFAFDPSLYERVKIEGFSIKPADDGDGLYVRVSDDDGATYENTGYDWGMQYQTFAADPAQTDLGGAADSEIGVLPDVGNAATENGSFELVLSGPNSALNKHIKGNLTADLAAGTGIVGWVGGRFTGNTNAINGLRFFCADSGGTEGNIASGVFIMTGILV